MGSYSMGFQDDDPRWRDHLDDDDPVEIPVPPAVADELYEEYLEQQGGE